MVVIGGLGAGGGDGVSWGLLLELESWSSGRQAMLLMDEFGVDVDPEVTCDDDVGNCNKGRVKV